jgi:hypothetical protein
MSKVETHQTYQMNVLLNPLKDKALIKQASIQISTSFDFFASKETPRTDAVIKIDNNHVVISSFDQASSIEVCVRVFVEASTLNEKIDRARLGVVDGSIDIEEEAVFRETGRNPSGWGWKTNIPVLFTLVHDHHQKGETYGVGLLSCRIHERILRSLEAKITNRRSSVSDAEPLHNLVISGRDASVLGIAKIDSEVDIGCKCSMSMMGEDENRRQDCGEDNHCEGKDSEPTKARVSKVEGDRSVPF